MPMRFDRQLDLFDPSKFKGRVSVVGAGGIGGITAFGLAKLGVRNMKVYDDDIVEPQNQPNQVYGQEDLYSYKVKKLDGLVRRYADKDIKPIVDRYREYDGCDVLMSCVDSMESRRAIYQNSGMAHWLIDGRIGGEVIRIYTCDLTSEKSRKAYEETLDPGRKVHPVPCTRAAVIDVMLAVGALMVRAFRLAVVDGQYKRGILVDQRNLTIYED